MAVAASLSVARRFHEELVELPREHQKRIIRALNEMQTDHTHRSKQLEGLRGVWRREVAPYRILFVPGPGWIHVYSVRHRQGVYSGTTSRPLDIPTSTPPEFSALDDQQQLPGESKLEGSAPVIDPWELAGKVLSAESPEDLAGLIDLGLPEALFDRLYEVLSNREAKRHGPVNVWLIKRNVIDAFFGRVIRLGVRHRPAEIVVVVPWITPWAGERSSLDAFLVYLRKFPARTTIITRTPQMPAHAAAVASLKKFADVEISFLDDLHAKYFICDMPPVPFALIGSANSTAKSFSNLEVGVFVRGSGSAETFVRELQGLTTELLGIGRRVKRRGTGT